MNRQLIRITAMILCILLMCGCGKSQVITVEMTTPTSTEETILSSETTLLETEIPTEPTVPTTTLPTGPAETIGETEESTVTEPDATDPVETESEETVDTGVEQNYVLNNNSQKFHYPNCSSAKQIKDSNRAEFHGTRDELIQRGYSPCGRCKP